MGKGLRHNNINWQTFRKRRQCLEKNHEIMNYTSHNLAAKERKRQRDRHTEWEKERDENDGKNENPISIFNLNVRTKQQIFFFLNLKFMLSPACQITHKLLEHLPSQYNISFFFLSLSSEMIIQNIIPFNWTMIVFHNIFFSAALQWNKKEEKRRCFPIERRLI